MFVRKYRRKSRNGVQDWAHRDVAERTLGKRLPLGAEVHHVDGDGSNNAPTNLVVCQNRAYHMLLHRRARAYSACQNANAKQCRLCKKYDRQEDIYTTPRSHVSHHLSCAAEYQRVYRRGTKYQRWWKKQGRESSVSRQRQRKQLARRAV